MSWHEGRLIGFDVETTGPDPETARIVTAAVVACGGGLETETLTLLADPGIPIPDEAAAIHGITTEKAQAEGHPSKEVITAIMAVLVAYTRHGWPIVAYNARFDLTVLDRECRRHGIKPLFDHEHEIFVIDPRVIDLYLDKYRSGGRKLDAVCLHYNAVLTDAHASDADALAACRLAWRLGNQAQVIRRTPRHGGEARELNYMRQEWAAVRHDLPELHAAQVRWARAQGEDLRKHFRETGKDDPERVSLDWPVVPPQPEAVTVPAADTEREGA